MRANARPFVSVCIPTYDDSPVVADSVRSAMRQKYVPMEILVVDNRSTDKTWDIVNSMAVQDRRLRVVRNAENIGMARNFSECIRQAKGEYVLILCADDALQDGCVELLATTLRDHPGAVLAACARIFTDPRLRPQRIHRARSEKEEVSATRMVRECFVYGNRIGEPSAVMFRRSAATRGFDPNYSQAIDLEMWFHLLEKGSAILLPEACCLIRQHAQQATRANLRSGRVVRDKQMLFREYAPRVLQSLTLLDKLVWDLRMASSLARTQTMAEVISFGPLTELFYPSLFRMLVYPLVASVWRLRNIAAA